MKFHTLMVIKAIVCLVFATAILLVPEILYSIYGLRLDPGATYPARQYGAALTGLFMVTWFARNAIESQALKAIVLGLCVYDAVGCFVSLAAVISGKLNPLGWSIVALYLFFAVGFGYFLVKSPQSSIQESTA